MRLLSWQKQSQHTTNANGNLFVPFEVHAKTLRMDFAPFVEGRHA